MSDIDFDEIDKAVNSVVEDGGANDQPALLDGPSEDNSVEQQAVVSTPDAPSTANVAPSQPAASPAIRRSAGRFMDVVHPSSDMRSPASPMLNRAARPRVEPAPPMAPIATPQPEAVDTSLPVDNVPVKPAFPDPIDLEQNHTFEAPQEEDISASEQEANEPASSVFTQNEPADPSPVIQEAIEPEESREEPTTDQPTVLSQYESPFLENAEVEKRPLGAHADAVDQNIDATADSVAAFSEDKPPVSAVTSDIDALDAAAPAAELEEQDYVEPVPKEEDYVANVPTVEPPADSPDAPDPNVGPANMITPQYSPQPNTSPVATDEERSSPFDAAAYGQPIPSKKSHTWIWVLLAIVLVLIGAGAGAYLYFSGLL